MHIVPSSLYDLADHQQAEFLRGRRRGQNARDLSARDNGVTVVMISSELEELRQTCDRIAIISGGQVAGILPAAASSEEFGLLMVSKVK